MKRVLLNFPLRPIIIGRITSKGRTRHKFSLAWLEAAWKFSEGWTCPTQKKRVQERLCESDTSEGHSGQFDEHLCFMYPPNFQHLQLAVLYLLGHFLRQIWWNVLGVPVSYRLRGPGTIKPFLDRKDSALRNVDSLDAIKAHPRKTASFLFIVHGVFGAHHRNLKAHKVL